MIFRNIKGAGGKFKWTDRQFAEAWTKVRSRVFGVDIQGQRKNVMVPIADMLNHDERFNVSWKYSDEHGAFVMHAIRDIRRGEELLDSYGNKEKSQFLVQYGFWDGAKQNFFYNFTVPMSLKHPHS